ncbi:putative VIER F-box protein 1 [Orobanche minor]
MKTLRLPRGRVRLASPITYANLTLPLPNWRLVAADLVRLPPVTTAGGGGPLSPINYANLTLTLPNLRLVAPDLARLPPVTTAGGGGPLSPTSIATVVDFEDMATSSMDRKGNFALPLLLTLLIFLAPVLAYVLTRLPEIIDHTSKIPDECLSVIFGFVSIDDRRRCSLVWLIVEGQSRRHLALDASSEVAAHLLSIFTRFDSIVTLFLCCGPRILSINDKAMMLISLRCRNLTCLELHGCREISDRGMLALAQTCISLRKFSCSSCIFGAEGMNALLNNCTLEKLSIKRLRGIDEFAPEPIGPGIAATSLRSLTIELCHGPSFAPLLFGSNRLETLKILECTGDWDSILEGISKRSLAKVHLRNLPITDLGLMAISGCVSLRRFHLEHAPDDYFFEEISAIARSCRLLETLLLNGQRWLLEGD